MVEAAIGIDDSSDRGRAAGLHRSRPPAASGAGTLAADRILLHARALGVYGASPCPERPRHAVRRARRFRDRAARQCPPGRQRALYPDHPTQATTAIWWVFAETPNMTTSSALAGHPAIAGDRRLRATPIDGVDGPKTQSAARSVPKNRGLSADIVSQPIFHHLIDAVQSPSATG